MTPELVALAKQKASEAGLWPELVCAVVEQESGWDRWASRYEPGFMSRYIAPLLHKEDSTLTNTEAYSRAFSWGLMQVMGQVAREHGFNGPFLDQLCDPEIGLTVGCKVLAHKLASAEGNVEKALLLWNGGANKAYPSEVLVRAAKYKEPQP